MPSPSPRTARHTAGFSIVELIVSAALTLLLTGGIVTVFIGSRTAQTANERFAQIQETGQRALDLIARDVRAAGYSGCVSRPRFVNSTLNDPPADIWNLAAAPVRGYENVDAATGRTQLIREAAALAAPESDVLLLRGPATNAQTLRLQRDMNDDTDPLFVGDASKANWHVGDIVLAHSCEAHSYFAVSSLQTPEVRHDSKSGTDGQLNSTPSLGYTFRSGTELTPVETTVYYVGPSTRRPPFSSLWRRTDRRSAEEIAPGVERMQLQFGVDLDGDLAVDSYVDADAVKDWSTIRSVSVTFVVRALEPAEGEVATHQLADQSAGREEAPKQRTFSTVVALRNYFGVPQ